MDSLLLNSPSCITLVTRMQARFRCGLPRSKCHSSHRPKHSGINGLRCRPAERATSRSAVEPSRGGRCRGGGMGRFAVVEPRPRDAVERRGRHPRRARSVARFGHIDKRRQADVRCALRSETPMCVSSKRQFKTTVRRSTWEMKQRSGRRSPPDDCLAGHRQLRRLTIVSPPLKRDCANKGHPGRIRVSAGALIWACLDRGDHQAGVRAFALPSHHATKRTWIIG
jgi:hypothetical protein